MRLTGVIASAATRYLIVHCPSSNSPSLTGLEPSHRVPSTKSETRADTTNGPGTSTVIQTAHGHHLGRPIPLTPLSTRPPAPSPRTPPRLRSVVPPQVHARVERCDLISVTVEHQGRAAQELADAAFLGLAPARMVNRRVHVGVEAVLVGRRVVPRG